MAGHGPGGEPWREAHQECSGGGAHAGGVASGDERGLSRLNAVRGEECSGRRGLAAGEA